MKLLYLLLSLCFLFCTEQASSQGLVYNKAIEDYYITNTVVYDDSSFLAAFACDYVHNIVISRIKNDGTILWSKELDDTLTTCVNDQNGQLSITFTFFLIPSTKEIILEFSSKYCSLMSGICNSHTNLIKTDSLLNPIWVKRASDISISDLIEINPGKYACRGSMMEEDGFEDPIIILMDSSGVLSNGKMFGWPRVWSILKISSNKIAVLYNWKNDFYTTWDDIELTIYDSLFVPQWSQCYGTVLQDLNYANLLYSSTANFYIVAGRPSNDGYFIIKTDSVGNVLSYKPYSNKYVNNSCLVNDTSVFLQLYRNTFALTNSTCDIVYAKHISTDTSAQFLKPLIYFNQLHQLLQFYSRPNLNSQLVNFIASFDSVFNSACPLLNDTLSTDTFTLVPCLTATSTSFNHAFFPYPIPIVNDTAFVNLLDTCNTILMSVDENQLPVFVNDELKLFPNPVRNQFTIVNPQSTFSLIEIFNSLGEKIYTATIHSPICIIHSASFSPGIYFVKATSGERMVYMRFIKE